MLRWGAATFDALGPVNRRGVRATPAGLALKLFGSRLREADVVPGSWAAGIFAAAARGEISRAEAKAMVIDFTAPSLDTTILASAEMLRLLGGLRCSLRRPIGTRDSSPTPTRLT
jgi:hypothetical protein